MQTREQTNSGSPGDLNHPPREEWMAHLYNELSHPDHERLSAHLKRCPECRVRVGEWRATMASLDKWKLPAVRPARAAQPLLKWAVAAALVFGLGLGLGSGYLLSANARNLAATRREMQTQFQVQLDQQRKQLIAEMTRVVDERSFKDSRVTLAALREMNAAHRADYDALHKELETMAVLTESGLRETHQQIVSLASTETQATPIH